MIHRPDPRCPQVGDEFYYHSHNGTRRYTVKAVDDDAVIITRAVDAEGVEWRWPRQWILGDIAVDR